MVRVAFIGAGGRAETHLGTLAEIDGAEVVAVCDVDREAAERAAAPRDAAVYTDHGELYEAEDLDAVFVVLPPFAHTGQEVMAAERGVDLFVEKPLGLSMGTARRVEAAVRTNGVVAAVGYQRRYADATRRALEFVEGRTIGLVEGYYRSGVPGGPDHWWRVRERSGGQVVEQATHVYDLVRLFGGEVRSVSAVGGHEVVEAIDFEDTVSANLVHEGGTVGNVTSTSAAQRYRSGVELVGEGLQLRLAGDSLAGVVDGEDVDYEGEGDPSRRAVEAFVEAVETGDPGRVRSDYADAVCSFELTLAVEESLATDERVYL